MNLLLLALLFLPPSGNYLPRTCEQIVCSHLADCAPMQTGGVDFTSYSACMADFECIGKGCLTFVDRMVCSPENPTWEDLIWMSYQTRDFRDACMGW